MINSQSWELIPHTLREEIAVMFLDVFTDGAVTALKEGVPQDQEGSAVTWMKLTVDEKGCRELRDILGDVEKRFRRMAARNEKRLGGEEGTPIVVAVAAFKATD